MQRGRPLLAESIPSEGSKLTRSAVWILSLSVRTSFAVFARSHLSRLGGVGRDAEYQVDRRCAAAGDAGVCTADTICKVATEVSFCRTPE